MFKSSTKKITVLQTRSNIKSRNSFDKESKLAPNALYITFSSVAAVIGACQSASAQLNVGQYGVQTGLETEYLQYQMSGNNLSQMRGIPACDVGFGLNCNKTATVLQQLVEKNNGASYNDLLMRAAGGQENFNKFANFYGNNPNLAQVPYASFWQNDSAYIMDGYQYLLGQSVSRTPVEGLGVVTKNFYWSPLSESNNSLSPRSGLVDLKLSYGRLLLEEASKIPNIQQQIQSLGLPQDITHFYLNTLSKGLGALSSGDEKQLQDSIFHVLSHPFSEHSENWGRPTIGIPKNLEQIYGEVLPGDSLLADNPVLLEGDAIALDIPTLEGEAVAFDIPGLEGDVLVAGGSGGIPGWLMGSPLALLLLLLFNGGSSGHHSAIGPNVSFQPSSGEHSNYSTPVGSSSNSNSTNTTTTTNEVKKVPEPSVAKSLLLLLIFMCMLSYKQRRKPEVKACIQIGD